MFSGPHRINMIPGGIPHVIHTSQYENWYSLSFYLVTWNGGLRRFYIDSDIPAWLVGRRPDGKLCVAALRTSGIIVVNNNGVAEQRLKDPYYLEAERTSGGQYDLDYTEGNAFTEIAGDVICEIIVNVGHAKTYDEMESLVMHSANFIIRVEPSPQKKVEDGIKGISVAQPPAKTSYKMGERLDLTGMAIQVEYDDGTSEQITDFTSRPADGETLTAQNISF